MGQEQSLEGVGTLGPWELEAVSQMDGPDHPRPRDRLLSDVGSLLTVHTLLCSLPTTTLYSPLYTTYYVLRS